MESTSQAAKTSVLANITNDGSGKPVYPKEKIVKAKPEDLEDGDSQDENRENDEESSEEEDDGVEIEFPRENA